MFVEIFGTESCPYCIKAKNICIENNYNYKYLLIGKEITKEEAIEKIGFEFSKVPQIIVDNRYVGGCDSFISYLEDLKNLDEGFGDFDI